jgi:hypothetical protein
MCFWSKRVAGEDISFENDLRHLIFNVYHDDILCYKNFRLRDSAVFRAYAHAEVIHAEYLSRSRFAENLRDRVGSAGIYASGRAARPLATRRISPDEAA